MSKIKKIYHVIKKLIKLCVLYLAFVGAYKIFYDDIDLWVLMDMSDKFKKAENIQAEDNTKQMGIAKKIIQTGANKTSNSEGSADDFTSDVTVVNEGDSVINLDDIPDNIDDIEEESDELENPFGSDTGSEESAGEEKPEEVVEEKKEEDPFADDFGDELEEESSDDYEDEEIAPDDLEEDDEKVDDSSFDDDEFGDIDETEFE